MGDLVWVKIIFQFPSIKWCKIFFTVSSHERSLFSVGFFFSPGLVFSLQEFSPEISLQDIFSEITHIPPPPPPPVVGQPLR